MNLYSIIRSKSLAAKPLKCSTISNKSFNGSWMKEIFGFNDHDILEIYEDGILCKITHEYN